MINNNEAIILHSIDDVDNCIENKLHENRLIFSTHSSADTYMRVVHGVDACCLSSFLTLNERKLYRDKAYRNVYDLLQKLDLEIMPFINEKTDFNMRYMMPLYSYRGKYQFSGYIYFVETVRRVMNLFHLKKTYFYQSSLHKIFGGNFCVEDCISLFFENEKTEILKYSKTGTAFKNIRNKTKKTYQILKNNPSFLFKRFQKLRNSGRKSRLINNDINTILLYEDLYDLNFLLDEMKNENIIFYDDSGRTVPIGIENYKNDNLFSINLEEITKDISSNNPFERLFLKDIIDDFINNTPIYLDGISILRDLHTNYDISLGIWGNPPIEGFKTLVFEYLKSENVKVVGAQHGSSYVDSIDPLHIDSDFNRCDYYFSYGFNNEDLNRAYPKNKFSLKVVPVGKTEPEQNKKKKKRIDILFPITNTFSIMDKGMIRTPPHELTNRQIEILYFLDSLSDKEIYVKPFPFFYSLSNYQLCSIIPVLKKLKNIKIVDHISLNKFLLNYNPRAIIMELPSTPLFDILHLDVEIFLMNDDLRPYETLALEELKKRVHYSEDLKVIIKKLNCFFNGELNKKRDNTFYNHYVFKKNRKRNIVKFIHSVSQKSEHKYFSEINSNYV